jgi:hypothetical protein
VIRGGDKKVIAENIKLVFGVRGDVDSAGGGQGRFAAVFLFVNESIIGQIVVRAAVLPARQFPGCAGFFFRGVFTVRRRRRNFFRFFFNGGFSSGGIF